MRSVNLILPRFPCKRLNLILNLRNVNYMQAETACQRHLQKGVDPPPWIDKWARRGIRVVDICSLAVHSPLQSFKQLKIFIYFKLAWFDSGEPLLHVSPLSLSNKGKHAKQHLETICWSFCPVYLKGKKGYWMVLVWNKVYTVCLVVTK